MKSEKNEKKIKGVKIQRSTRAFRRERERKRETETERERKRKRKRCKLSSA